MPEAIIYKEWFWERKANMKFIRKILYNLIKKDIECQITRRILAFHDALIERKQIKPIPEIKTVDEKE